MSYINNPGGGGGGSTPPGGLNTQVQFNNSGAFSGDSNFTWTIGTGLHLGLPENFSHVSDPTPVDGDFWFDGTSWNFRTGTSTLNPFMLQVSDQILVGGTQIAPLALTTGSVTLDPGQRPQQYIANTGAFTITAPSADGNMLLQVENGVGAGAVTFIGFTNSANTGEPLDTVNGHKFVVSIWRIHGVSSYTVKALQ